MRHETVSDRIRIYIGDTYEANTTVIRNGRGEVLLLDALGSATDVDALRAHLAAEGLTVRTIVMSHYFSDHMAALRHFPEAQVIAHEYYSHTFTTERFRTEEEEAHFVKPSLTIGAPTVIDWDGIELELFPNPGHTMSTINIDIPAADLLHVGDTVVGNIIYLAYNSPTLIERALLRARSRGRGRVMASHGGTVDGGAIERSLTYLYNLGKHVRAAGGNGNVADIKIEDCVADGVEANDFERIFHDRNLQSIADRRLFLDGFWPVAQTA